MIAFVLFCVLALANGQNLQVTTSQGVVEGYPAADGNYHTFHGIPYATARTGLDMFKPATPPGQLPGVLHAYDSGIRCARPGPDEMIGVINCLVLNVFTGGVTTAKPVLVWLNGEEDDPSITSQFSYRRLIEEDVVVVTLNYRLSVYGFLCIKTEQHPGNAGLKDIILGLQWVRNNIAAFGGDPNNVVLMGHGSAAAMVDLISLSPKSDNLVHKAISLSGSGVAPWAISYDPMGAAITFMSVFGVGLQADDDIPVFLAGFTLANVNDALNEFSYTNNTQIFAPCIEDNSSEDAVLTDFPINLLRSGNYRHIPYLAGYVTREGTQRAKQAVNDRWLEQMQAGFTNFLPADLDLGDDQASVTQTIREYYFGTSPINMTTIDNYFHYHGDTMVTMPAIRGVRERAATSTSEVRLLEFGYMGTNNSDWTFEEIPLQGVRHGGILNYIFDFNLLSSDENVANSIVKRISSFALNSISQSDWPVVTNATFPYLHYGGSPADAQHLEASRVNPQNAKMTFWDEIYDKYYNAPSSASRLIGLLCVIILNLAFVTIIV